MTKQVVTMPSVLKNPRVAVIMMMMMLVLMLMLLLMMMMMMMMRPRMRRMRRRRRSMHGPTQIDSTLEPRIPTVLH